MDRTFKMISTLLSVLIVVMMGGFGCHNGASPTMASSLGIESSNLLYSGGVLAVTILGGEVIVANISGNVVAIRVSFDGKDPWGKGEEGSDSSLHPWVKPEENVRRSKTVHDSVQVWGWDSSGALLDSCDLPIQSGNGTQLSLYSSSVLSVTGTEADVVVKNMSGNPIAIRISFDGKDPWGTGEEGADSSLHSWMEPGESIRREAGDHITVRVWAWDGTGALLDDSGDLALP